MDTDVLDIARIEKELQEINQQRSQAREGLDALRGGRGRGPAGMGGRGDDGRRGVFSRLGDSGLNGAPAGPRDPSAPGRPSVFDRLYSQGSRPSGPAADREERLGRESASGHELHRSSSAPIDDPSSKPLGRRLSSRISSAVVAPANAAEDQAAAGDGPDRTEAAEGRKRLLSAVMVNGQARQLSGSLDRVGSAAAADERPPKRPTLAADARTKQRAARMFGTLVVGTLQKFQSDEQSYKNTQTAQRRAEMERRAQERAETEAQRLREEAASAWRHEKEAKLNALHDLNLQADIKALQLRYAKRIQLRQQLTGFCVTSTQPPLYWLPKQSSKEAVVLLEASEAAFEAWKQLQLQELEAERAELAQAAAAKREAALSRIAARQAPSNIQEGGGDENGLEGSEGEEGEGDKQGGPDEDQQMDAAQQEQQQVQQEQYPGGQQQDEEMPDDDDDVAQVQGEEQQEAEQQQEQRQQQQQQCVRRQRQRGSDDEEEERLLSSDDEDA